MGWTMEFFREILGTIKTKIPPTYCSLLLQTIRRMKDKKESSSMQCFMLNQIMLLFAIWFNSQVTVSREIFQKKKKKKWRNPWAIGRICENFFKPNLKVVLNSTLLMVSFFYEWFLHNQEKLAIHFLFILKSNLFSKVNLFYKPGLYLG